MNAFVKHTKRLAAYFCAVLVIFSLIFSTSSCSFLEMSENEKMFVAVYKKYVEQNLENPETIEIVDIEARTDEKGGVAVRFQYKHQTEGGYFVTDSHYVVTSKITIDATLVELSGIQEIMYGSEVKAYNGQSVDIGFNVEKLVDGFGISSTSAKKNVEILTLWWAVQSTSTRDYNLKKINNAINN